MLLVPCGRPTNKKWTQNSSVAVHHSQCSHKGNGHQIQEYSQIFSRTLQRRHANNLTPKLCTLRKVTDRNLSKTNSSQICYIIWVCAKRLATRFKNIAKFKNIQVYSNQKSKFTVMKVVSGQKRENSNRDYYTDLF